MIGFGSPHLELEGHLREFENGRLREQLAIARQGHPVRPRGRRWSPYFFLALKSLGLLEILRMALDGGVPN